ncbi:MAG: S8 family serine peptidase [Anaerolineae bacterium]
MFSPRRWFVILHGFTLICVVLALFPLSASGASLRQNEAPQAENPPPEEPSLPAPEVNKAEGAGSTHTIYLKSRQFAPVTSELTALRQVASALARARMHVLLQLDFIPRQAAKEALAAEGIELLAYIPDYTWIASVSTAHLAEVAAHPGVTWIGQLQVQDKLDPAIVKEQWGPYNLTPAGVAAVYVALHRDESLETGRALVAQHGGKVVGEVAGIHLLVVEMPRANIEALAADDAVQWVEPAAPPLTEANDGSRQQIGVDVVQAAPYSLDGTNIDVLVYDGGRVGAHVDFGTRLITGDTTLVSEHATHVAGTVGGSGANSAAQGGTALQWRGMATNVDLISYGATPTSGYYFYEDVMDIQADWAQAQNSYGADLGTASLGSNIYANYSPGGCFMMGKYGASSVLLDQIVRGGNSAVGIGDKYIATWAAGNERGWSSSCAGLGGGYGLVAPPAGAKNPIHVGGANTNDNTQYVHTSWGPTEDGRLKPIVTAGACQTSGDYGIKSTDDNPVNAYTVKCGTSMATPAVAGGIALMLQHYRAVYNTSGNFWPSTAKAILIHTATDLGNPGPDYQWGYGLANIHAAVDLISRKAFRQDNIAQGEVDVYYFIVPTNAMSATVSLAWDDFEATFNANPTLINNLDLELVAPSGEIWYPWILNPATPSANATRAVDNRNNQEMVQVPTPEVGTWLVRVRGTTVPQGPQDYSLVCEGCKPLNLGVCQAQVSGGTLMASPAEADPEALGAAGISAEEVLRAHAPQQATAGELWQRALEADAVQVVRQAQTQSALDALEAARAAGPAAVSALGESLSPVALDLVIDEVVAARERLPEPPPPESHPVWEAEEPANLQAQEAVEAAARALALTDFGDPAEGGALEAVPHRSALSQPDSPSVDRTVGNGCTYATIAAAIAAANPGDTLLLEGGRTFTENITIPITLTVQGGYPGCASGSSARTTLNGNASGTVVIVNRAIAVSLRNLNITNGNTGFEGGGIRFAWGGGTGTLNLSNVFIYGNTAQWGGGLWVGPNADVSGETVEIYNNTATTFGGGVRLYGGRATFLNSYIYGNSAPLGGGLYATREDGYAPVANLTTSDLYSNQALSGSGLGGGVYLREGTLTMLSDSDLIGNNATYGGGAYLVTGTLTLDGSASWVYNNTAASNGGGVYAQGSTVYLYDEAQVYNNSAETGGGAYLDASSLYGRKASIRYNTANLRGGGVYATNGSTFDMGLGNYTCVGVRCSRLSNNTATTYYGGGVYLGNSTAYLRNTFIESNVADYGGGVYAYNNSSVYAYNSLFARNNAVSGNGDAVRLNLNAALTGAGNTLAYNDAGGAATGQAIGLTTSSLSLHCSIIWGHTSSIDTAGQNVTYSDIQGGYAGVGNLNVNPQFVASGGSDYHLQATSPLIDRCAFFSGMNTDFENEIRPIVRSTAASPYDMGADEVSGVARVGVNGACAYGTIQQAVNAAQDGDTVRIAAGVYFETVDVAGKNITLAGGYNSTCTAYITGTTRIEGSATSGSVLDVSSSVLAVRNLDIAWGSGIGGGVDALGNARITLDNVDVLRNSASYAAGIYVSSNSVVTLTNGSQLYGNNASSDAGGGARVWGQFFVYGESSEIYENCATSGGGFYVPGGRLTIEQADVLSNQAAAADGKGGGIYVTNGGTVSLRRNVAVGASLFMPNQTAYDGAGIYADNSTVALDAVDLGYNIAVRNGGGLYLGNNSTLQAVNTNLGNSIWFFGTHQWGNQASSGGGLYADASVVDFSGTIATNLANIAGGGVYATNNSTLNLTNATVGLSGSALGNRLGTSGGSGAGLYLAEGTTAVLSNTVVVSNTFQTTGFTYGGGAYLSNSTLTLYNSRIEQHYAPSVSDGRGAGIYLNNSTATLDNSRILSNTAGTVGGGVRMWNTSTLNVLNGSVIGYNTSLNDVGGAIAAGGTPDINIVNATLRNNTAATHGGAVYLDSGTLDFTGGWTLRENTATGGNGGAIAAVGTADVSFRAGGYSLGYFNRALGGHGGMLYLSNTTTAQLYATDGHAMYIYANQAGGNGGALYANNGGLFDIYGQVSFDRNRADHGGAIYLGNGSRVWLDDYVNRKPQLGDNFADYGSGGAIYALNSPRVECDGAVFGQAGGGNHAAVDGGALYLSGSTLNAENCLFIGNEAATHGGAIAAYTSTLNLHANYGAVVGLTAGEHETRDAALTTAPLAPAATTCNPRVELCSVFYNNVADSDTNDTGLGGGIYSNDSVLTVNHTKFYSNTAYYGGAILQTGTNAVGEVSNSLVYSNTVRQALGAGIRRSNGAFTVTHTTLANNIGGSGFSGVASAAYNTIAWGNTASGFAVTPTIASCNIDDGGNAGLNIDPRFVDAANGDFHLLGDSPAIDACPTGLTPDLDNVVRPAILAYDMGAFEYPYGMTFVPDRSGVGYPAQDVVYVHTLSNIGGVADTFSFTGLSSQGWGFTLPAPLTLGVGEAALVTVTLHVPAGVLSGTVDTLRVTAISQTDPTLTAVVTDTTTVGFTPGIAFTPPSYTTLGAIVGNTYNYTHILTNTGNAQDSFTLAFGSSRGWGSLLTPGPFTLNPGQTANVVVAVTVPSGGGGLSDLSVVTATSTGGAGPLSVQDTTSAFTPGLAFAPDYTREVSPDAVVTYTHTLTNTSAAADTYALAITTSQGWATLLDPGPFALPGGGTATVRVRVTVPPGSGGLTDTTIVTATSFAGAPPAAVRDTTAVYPPGVALAPDYAGTLNPGEAITYTHTLTNTGAGPDTIDVALALSSQGWATLLDPGPFALAAGASTPVRVLVTAPPSSGGLIETTVLTASSRAGVATASVTDTTTVPRVYGVSLTPDGAQTLTPGTAYTYTHQLANTGNATDTFRLALTSTRGWAMLAGTDTYTLPTSGAVTVLVRVDVPVGSGGLVDIARLTATSVSTDAVTAGVTDTTTALYTPGLILEPDNQDTALPPAFFGYTHWLTNTGTGSDLFTLEFYSSQGWGTLLEAGPVPLAAGEGISLHVEINVPAGTGGMVETSVLTATAQTGGVSARVTDMISVTQLFGVDLFPDYAQSVPPGGSYIYQHVLRNTGNGPDTFAVNLTSSRGWATLLDAGPFALAADATTNVRVRVSVPTGLISGTQSDIAVLNVTSLTSPALSASATDTTTVGFAPGALFEDDGLTLNAIPGAPYTYTHWLTNTGNYTDTFNMAFDSSLGWGTLLDPGPFVLAMGEATGVRVRVDVPADGAGKFDISVVTATSAGGAGPLVVYDTTAAFMPGITLTPNYAEWRDPGDVITYVHTLHNTGTTTDVITLALESSQGWAVLHDPGPYTLAAGESITLGIVVTIPLGTGGLVDVSRLTAKTLGGFGPSATVTDTTTVNYTPGVALGPDFVQTVPAGSAVIYTHHLTNTGNGPATFGVALSSSRGWGTLLDSGPFALASGDSTPVRVQVAVPTDTYALQVDVTTLTATLGTLNAVARDTTTVACEPIIGANFTYTPAQILATYSTTFIGTAWGSLPLTYTWNFGDGSAVQTGNPIAHTFSTTGSLTVTMMVANPCTTAYLVTRAVTVNAAPNWMIYLPLVLRND